MATVSETAPSPCLPSPARCPLGPLRPLSTNRRQPHGGGGGGGRGVQPRGVRSRAAQRATAGPVCHCGSYYGAVLAQNWLGPRLAGRVRVWWALAPSAPGPLPAAPWSSAGEEGGVGWASVQDLRVIPGVPLKARWRRDPCSVPSLLSGTSVSHALGSAGHPAVAERRALCLPQGARAIFPRAPRL